jgi:phosphoglycolate phosphatase
MKKMIMFDFDGVVVNTFDMVLGLKHEIGQTISADDFRNLFLGNYYKEVEKSQDESYKERDKDNDEWFKLYGDKILELDPVEGIIDAISALSHKYTLVVVSSSLKSPIQKYLDQHNISSYFEKIFDANVHRSKVEKIKMAQKEFGVAQEDCMFITDTLGDIKEAREANVESIAVTWGFHDQAILKAGEPYGLADNPEDMLTKIENWSHSS